MKVQTQRVLLASLWIALIVASIAFTRSRGLTPLEAADELRMLISDHWWGPALFIAAYVLRPVILFPASVLTILGGLTFGLVSGVFWTVVAANLSVAAMYFAGRFFGSGEAGHRMEALLGRTVERAHRFPFETTILMRLLYLPFDAVGYAAGFLKLRFVPFALGSFIGTLPGTVAFVGFGASIESLDEGTPSFDLRILGASVLLAIGGSLLSRWLRRGQVEDETVRPEHLPEEEREARQA